MLGGQEARKRRGGSVMQVLLISANTETEPYPVEPIGLAYVAASLTEAGHAVKALDLCFEEDGPGAASKAVDEWRPGLVGISLRNTDNLTWPKGLSYLPPVKGLVAAIKGRTGAPIVIGGSGFSLFPRETLDYLGLDYGIAGEGEAGMAELARLVESGGAISGVPGLVTRSPYGRCATREAASFGSIYPARDLIDGARYTEAGGMANVQTKRGCPFECVYCTYPVLEGKKLRLREPRDVGEEIERLWKGRGADYFFFVDDIFNVPASHAIAICEELIRRSLKVRWACFCTPRGITKELLHAMKSAGCAGIEFGTDGGTDATLEAMGKGFTAADVERAQALCHEAGVEAAHYLILGGPGETRQTLRETYGFMESIRPRAVIAMLGVRIYPGTGLETIAAREGVIRPGENLLEPRFYISGDVRDILLEDVGAYARTRPNWVVPGLEIRSGARLAKALAQMGKRGVMWDMLGA